MEHRPDQDAGQNDDREHAQPPPPSARIAGGHGRGPRFGALRRFGFGCGGDAGIGHGMLP